MTAPPFRSNRSALVLTGYVIPLAFCALSQPLVAVPAFLAKHCTECHDADTNEAGLNLEELSVDFSDPATVDNWQKVLEQLETHQMPPRKKPRPDAAVQKQLTEWIRKEFTRRNIVPIIDHKRRHPDFGNRLDHDSLFDGSSTVPAYSPPRLWRLSPHIYDEFVKNLGGLRHAVTIHQPFAIDENKGIIADYSAQHLADSATLQLLMMNCQSIASYQTTGILKREWDGRMRLHRQDEEVFRAIVDSKTAPTNARLSAAISHEYRLFLGRAPTASELENTMELAGKAIQSAGNALGLQAALVSVMLKPEVIYRLEIGFGEPDEHGRRRLSPHELAFALAYTLTDKPPDQVSAGSGSLLSLAHSGKLDSPDQIRRAVRHILDANNMSVADYRMFTEDHKVRNTRTLRFFREFFGYHHAPRVFKDENRISVNSGFDTKRIVTDADQFVMHIFDKDHDVLRQLLTSNQYFVTYLGSDEHFRHDLKYIRENVNDAGYKTNIAYINRIEAAGKTPIPLEGPSSRTYVGFYNLDHETWDYPRRQPFPLPKSQRAGILTHPAWLIAWSGNFDNDPIRRGKWIREHLLADHVPEIPITVDAVIPEERLHTLRKRLESTRARECWRCHKKMNPLGLPFENFDDFGRFRSAEMLDNILTIFPDRHRDARHVPVDTSGAITDSGDAAIDGPVADVFELVNKLAGSTRVRQSFVRHNFRYWLGRNETFVDSSTLIAADKAYMDNGGSMKALIASLLSSDSFLYRK
jgi:hypothetical protein